MASWEVRECVPVEAAAATLAEDRIWNGYSLADLVPPFREYTRVWLARRPETPASALLILRHPAFTALVPHGPAAGLAAILDAAELPAESFLLARDEHLPPVRARFAGVEGLHPMLRMHLTPARYRPPVRRVDGVSRLGSGDLAALLTLYADYSEGVFNTDQLAAGPFFGIRAGGRLVAAGGIHVVARPYAIAAVGNIYTLPEARGRGYGEAVTAAVIGALFAAGCRDLILNVATDNVAAQRIYRRLGFVEHCAYQEGMVRRWE